MLFFFFFNDTATTEIYTLSLHDALPISKGLVEARPRIGTKVSPRSHWRLMDPDVLAWQTEYGFDEQFLRNLAEVRSLRSEEHTSELQSRQYLVCRLLLEKKKNNDLPRSA